MKYFDAHTHVQFSAFDSDRGEAIKRAEEAHVSMINVGTDRKTSKEAVELTYKFSGLWATVGLHPTDVEAGFDYDFYKKLAEDSKVVAIGECGLDYYRVKSNEKGVVSKQKDVFVKQIELAREVQKPLMIHCRNAFSDLIDILFTNYQLLITPGIIHFFSGTKDDAKKLLELGFYFTFGGVITFVRDYDEVIKTIPADRILSETDAPYVTPVPHRGKRNEPAYVVEVVKKLAEIKNLSVDAMAEQILKNTENCFNLKLL